MAASITALVIVAVAVAALVLLAAAIRLVKQYERGVHFRLGRVIAVRDPGLRLIIPVIDRLGGCRCASTRCRFSRKGSSPATM